MCGRRESFLSFYVTNGLSIIVGFMLPMTEKWHNLAIILRNPEHCKHGCWQQIGNMFEHDLLHHRGLLCCKAFLKNRSNAIASLQYMIFILVQNYTNLNVLVFPNFSEEANFDFQQQALFVFIAWSMDQVIYELLNVLCKNLYDLTPLFVGAAVRKEHSRLRVSLLLIAAHIISDVYISMIFAIEGGFYFIDDASTAT